VDSYAYAAIQGGETVPSLPPEDRTLRLLANMLLRSGYRFVTPTPETHRRVNSRPGNAWAQDTAGVFGWSRPFRPNTLTEPFLSHAPEANALMRHGEGWRSQYRLSTLDDLGFLHSSYPTVEGDSVFFGPDTYRFASALTAYLRDAPAPRRVVDIGCGAGTGAMLIARAYPMAETIMVDINPKAVRLARINASMAGLERIDALESDLLGSVPGKFDLIVANPPYLVDVLSRAYRNGGGPLGAGLSLEIVRTATERLAAEGTLLLYTGAAIVNGTNPFLSEAAHILRRAGFTWQASELDPDVFGEELDQGWSDTADRIAVVCLIATRPG
jgi:release factor glutamine methyltransferase